MGVERFELQEGFSGWDLHPSDAGDYVEYEDYARLRAELAEQARLNGMGSEREARLMAQLAACQAENLRLREALEEAVKMVGHPDNVQILQAALATKGGTDALRDFGLRVAKQVYLDYGGDAAQDDFEAIVDEILKGGRDGSETDLPTT